MNKLFAVSLACLGLAVVPLAHGADLKAERQALITRINDKISAAKDGDVDLSAESKDLDALLAAHKDERTDDAASLLALRVELNLSALQNYAQAADDLRTAQKDFPDSDLAKRAKSMLPAIEKMAAAQKVQDGLAIGTPFPDFQVTDLDGKPLSPLQDKGKIVLVDFWATWCPPCMKEFPRIVDLYKQYHDKGLDIIGISLDHSKEKLESFVKAKQVAWPQYFEEESEDQPNKLAAKYGIVGIPMNYLLGKDGKIIGKNLHGTALDNAVKAAVGVN